MSVPYSSVDGDLLVYQELNFTIFLTQYFKLKYDGYENVFELDTCNKDTHVCGGLCSMNDHGQEENLNQQNAYDLFLIDEPSKPECKKTHDQKATKVLRSHQPKCNGTKEMMSFFLYRLYLIPSHNRFLFHLFFSS
jgi:hypothetical protein